MKDSFSKILGATASFLSGFWFLRTTIAIEANDAGGTAVFLSVTFCMAILAYFNLKG